MRRLIVSVVLAAAAAAIAPSAASAASCTSGFTEARVCAAYHKDSRVGRFEYYDHGNDPGSPGSATASAFNAAYGCDLPDDASWASLVTCQMRHMYRGGAANWLSAQMWGHDAGEYKVGASLSIRSISLSAGKTRATLRTRERWLVREPDGGRVFSSAKSGKVWTIQMAKVRGGLAGRWVVTGIG